MRPRDNGRSGGPYTAPKILEDACVSSISLRLDLSPIHPAENGNWQLGQSPALVTAVFRPGQNRANTDPRSPLPGWQGGLVASDLGRRLPFGHARIRVPHSRWWTVDLTHIVSLTLVGMLTSPGPSARVSPIVGLSGSARVHVTEPHLPGGMTEQREQLATGPGWSS